MGNIPGQRLSINENSIEQFVTSIDMSIEHLKASLESIKDANADLIREFPGGKTLSRFSNAAVCVEQHIGKTYRNLQDTNFQVQQATKQFVHIDKEAEQMAGLRRR